MNKEDVATALQCAAVYGHVGLVEQLIDREADIEARDNEGKTVLRWAVGMGHTKLLTC